MLLLLLAACYARKYNVLHAVDGSAFVSKGTLAVGEKVSFAPSDSRLHLGNDAVYHIKITRGHEGEPITFDSVPSVRLARPAHPVVCRHIHHKPQRLSPAPLGIEPDLGSALYVAILLLIRPASFTGPSSVPRLTHTPATPVSASAQRREHCSALCTWSALSSSCSGTSLPLWESSCCWPRRHKYLS